MPNEFVLGFQVRQQPVAIGAAENRDYTTHYLLRPDMDMMPRSVDNSVWSCAALPNVPTETRLPEWLNSHFLRIMNPDEYGGLPVIAISLVDQPEIISPMNDVSLSEHYQSAIALVSPAPEWVFYGYDIADESMISGLCNCGYSPEEMAELAPKWSERINEWGLIPDINDALEFQALTNTRVQEHAPFLIYGVYGVTTPAAMELIGV